MKLLIYGDVVGKLGRIGVKHTLPIWCEEFSPDVVVANVENIMHGKGIGPAQIQELKDAGVNVFTGGNHSVEGKDVASILNDETLAITRPANMREDLPGRGAVLYDMKFAPSSKSDFPGKSDFFPSAGVKLLVINLIGQVFMHQEYASPFNAIDKILEEYAGKTPFIILDWHADATSEKTVMGRYLDGKVSAVFGTHTHVPTADAKILPKGTAYISDIGMVGPYDSIIGVEVAPSIERFTKNIKTPKNPVESGPIEVNAIYLELSDGIGKPASAKATAGKAVDIRHLRKIVTEYRI
ncbi:hypothetical protein A2924_03325 [Candidatus Giovannonibacteria bacterium RIFCSPLOWO2_01_FULL_44_16]|uniref:Metallophosphoesterase n=1 Tax=Candidatus Giovannonibacteria bacterium RIFCSPLOWO2_01_FULL_44_16 TaxID=1798348 RepID=A0A1F5X612_9BACT|nr:MAG: hypothetical protein A2924_03325 [Candidatus Giovannonibacteria bacterium RIFCSPLOWO2_01_FULL_44_16]